MTDNDQLAQRYADLLDMDASFLPLVGELDAAAAPYRTLEPPPSLDQAIEQLSRQRTRATTNRPRPEAIETEPPSAAPAKTRHILPERLRGYRHQLLGMAAAIVVLVLFAGLIAALLRGPGGQDRLGAGVTASPTSTSQLPTPNADGGYHNLSLAQARQLVAFPIIEPNPLPDVLRPLPDDSVAVATIGSPGSTQANYVAFSYPAQDQAERGVTLVQTTVQTAAPADDGAALHWVDQNGEPVTVKYKQLILNRVSIAGVTVTKLDTLQDSGRVMYATWQKDGVSFVASSSLGPHVTAAVFDQFIAALIAPGTTMATPQATAVTPALPHVCEVREDSVTFAQAQQLAPFYITDPTWLPSYLVSQCVIGFREGETPDPSAQLLIEYGPPDGSQAYSVQIVEYTENHGAQPSGIPSALTIAGHVVAYSVTPVGYGTHSYFVWHDQGTIFQLDAMLGGPLTEQDVERMIASMLGGDEGAAGSSPVPTPNANGSYINLTLEQAQQLAPFKIVMPTDLPLWLRYGGLSLSIPPVAPAGLAKGVPNIANMTFGSSDDPHWFVAISEIWVGAQPPGTPSALATAASASGTPPVPTDHALPPTFQIGGVTVTKEAGTNSAGDPIASYEWIQGKAKIFLAVAHFDVEHEPDIYNMIASMIAQGS